MRLIGVNIQKGLKVNLKSVLLSRCSSAMAEKKNDLIRKVSRSGNNIFLGVFDEGKSSSST